MTSTTDTRGHLLDDIAVAVVRASTAPELYSGKNQPALLRPSISEPIPIYKPIMQASAMH